MAKKRQNRFSADVGSGRIENGNGNETGDNDNGNDNANGGGNGSAGNGNTINFTPPTAVDIKTDYLVDISRRTLTISSVHFVFGILTLMLCLATLSFTVYKLDHVTTELHSLRSEMGTVNKRHFMLAQDWCERMNPKK